MWGSQRSDVEEGRRQEAFQQGVSCRRGHGAGYKVARSQLWKGAGGRKESVVEEDMGQDTRQPAVRCEKGQEA